MREQSRDQRTHTYKNGLAYEKSVHYVKCEDSENLVQTYSLNTALIAHSYRVMLGQNEGI